MTVSLTGFESSSFSVSELESESDSTVTWTAVGMVRGGNEDGSARGGGGDGVEEAVDVPEASAKNSSGV